MIDEIKRLRSLLRKNPISKTHPWATATRWMLWQARSRISPRNLRVKWFENVHLIADRGMTGLTGNIYCGLHEFTDMAFVLHSLSGAVALNRESDRFATTFVDLGANAGIYTLLASGVAGARTIAVEPGDVQSAALLRNVTSNRLDSVVEHHKVGVGREDSVARFSLGCDTEDRVVSDDYTGETVEIPLASVDKLVAGRSVTGIKMDLEGMEEQAIQGAQLTLAHPDCQFVLSESNEPEFRTLMKGQGFQNFEYDWANRSLLPPESNRTLDNFLWIKHPELVTKWLGEADNFRIYGFSL